MESNQNWLNWLARLAIVRVGGAISGLSATYWATTHLSENAGAQFIGNSTALANGCEAAIALLVGAHLISRSHKWAIGAGFMAGIMALLVSLNPRLETIWLARVSDGIIAGLVTTTAMSAILAEAKNKPTGPRLIVGFESIVIVAFGLGSVVAAAIWPKIGTLIFLISGGLYLAAALIEKSSFVVKESPVGRPNFSVLRNPIFIGVLAMSTSASMWVSQVTFVMTSHKVIGQVFPGSMDKVQVAILIVAYLAALAVGLAIWSAVLVRIKPSLATVFGSLGAFLAPLVLLTLNLTTNSIGLRICLLGIYIVVLMVQAGLIPAILATVNKSRGDTSPLVLSSVFVVATTIGSVIGPLLGGIAVSSSSFSGICVASTVLAGITLASTFPGQLRDKSSRSRS